MNNLGNNGAGGGGGIDIANLMSQLNIKQPIPEKEEVTISELKPDLDVE